VSTALLIAEPEEETRDFLERHLAQDGFEVLGADAPAEALELAERARPDLVLAAEIELVSRLRQGEPGRSWDRDVPAIVLGTDRADHVDRAYALDRGADDYLARPFHYEELRARIRALLRRAAPHPDLVYAGEIVVDRPARTATVAGVQLDLPTKEYELLAKLAQRPTLIHTKDELLRDVWGYRSTGRTRTLDSHASRLRRKLAAVSATPYVINQWGVGYRLMDARG
jgi:DNA-binding response OmpR family regulator